MLQSTEKTILLVCYWLTEGYLLIINLACVFGATEHTLYKKLIFKITDF